MPGHLCNEINNQKFTYNVMRNIPELNGNWKETKGRLKQRFAILTDNDLLLIEGKEDELLGRLEKKLGKTKDELHKIIADI